MTCPGFVGDGAATLGGFETCFSKIFQKKPFFSDRQVKFTTLNLMTHPMAEIVTLQKNCKNATNDMIPLISFGKNPDLCSGTKFENKNHFPPGAVSW